jgi:hypothetical protein
MCVARPFVPGACARSWVSKRTGAPASRAGIQPPCSDGGQWGSFPAVFSSLLFPFWRLAVFRHCVLLAGPSVRGVLCAAPPVGSCYAVPLFGPVSAPLGVVVVRRSAQIMPGARFAQVGRVARRADPAAEAGRPALGSAAQRWVWRAGDIRWPDPPRGPVRSLIDTRPEPVCCTVREPRPCLRFSERARPEARRNASRAASDMMVRSKRGALLAMGMRPPPEPPVRRRAPRSSPGAKVSRPP